MMWTFAIKNKIKAALLLFAVLAVVVLTNFSERRSANKISTAMASIYEDRLVVEGYIFDHARLLEAVEEIIESNESVANKQALIGQELDKVSRLNVLYAATQLTPDEKVNFNNFKSLCEQLSNNVNAGQMENAKTIARQARDVLTTLSGIQMEEAKAQMDNVNRMSSFSSIVSQFELAVLVIIAVMVQILVFSSKTLLSAKYPGKAHLK